MIISIAVVASVDGKLTKHQEGNMYSWTSKEDQKYFRELIAEHEIIVMGRGTYEAIKNSLQLDMKKLRIVLTSRPNQFDGEAVEGRLEFSSETPKQLVDRLQREGFKNLLMVGGPRMISDFLQTKLVNYLHLTIEPYIFGQGKPMSADIPIDIQLQLVEYKQLNVRGTVLLVYKLS